MRAGEPVTTTGRVQVVPEHGLDALRGADLVAVPATGLREFPDEVLQALRDASAAGATLLTVCSGVFVLGAAGLLDGRRCTAHWRSVDELRARHPAAVIDPDVLFVDDGNLVTSAGTAAGIDAALHLVRRELGSTVVNLIARRMVVPPQRDGGQRQFVEQPIPQCSADGLAPTLDWVLENLRRRALGGRPRPPRPDVGPQLRAPVRRRDRHHPAPLAHPAARAPRPAPARGHRPGDRRRRAALRLRRGALLRHHFRKVVGVAPADYRRTFRAAPAPATATA